MTTHEAVLPEATGAPGSIHASPELSVIEPGKSNLLRLKSEDGSVIAVAPGENVGLHRLKIPTASESQARRAAPFVVEDKTAVDLQDVHVAVGCPDGEEAWLIGVVDHSTMAAWRDELSDHDVTVSALVPEPCLIPAKKSELVIVDRSDSVVVAYGAGLGFVIEPGLFRQMFDVLCTEAQIQSVLIYTDQVERLVGGLNTGGITINQRPQLSQPDYHELLERGVHAGPLNLMQGAYGTTASIGEVFKEWMPTLYGLAAVFVAFMAFGLFEATSLRHQAEQLEAETQAVFRAAMPDVTRIVNPRAQIQARLQSIQSTNGDVFLALSAALFEGLSQSQNGRLDSLQFDESRMSVLATLSLSDYSEIEQLRTALEAKGYAFQEGSSRSEGSRILSDIQVGMP